MHGGGTGKRGGMMHVTLMSRMTNAEVHPLWACDSAQMGHSGLLDTLVPLASYFNNPFATEPVVVVFDDDNNSLFTFAFNNIII